MKCLSNEDYNLYPAPTCMICGKLCDKVEEVQTDDSESKNGMELWCYCDDCKMDTFHKALTDEEIKKLKEEESGNQI